MLDEYEEADVAPIDIKGSFHMPTTTLNDVTQIKYRFQNSLASFVCLSTILQENMIVLEWSLIITLIRECWKGMRTLIFCHGGKIMVSSILLYKEFQKIF